MSYPQVKISVSEPIRISPPGERHWFPRLHTLPDGRIIQFDTTYDDTTEALQEPGGASVRLADPNGTTWQEVGAPPHFSFPVNLRSGVIRSFSYIHWHRDDSAAQYAAVADFDPVSLTWTERPDAKVNLPVRAVSRAGSASAMEIDRSVLLEPDGSLLATMYGKFEGDERFRVILVRSVDDGENWDFVSTVAYDPNAGAAWKGIGPQGFCEPVMIRAKDGSLLVMMRTGSYSAMFQTRSIDDGKSWETPVNMGALSVDPDFCLMRNGLLACSFGRPTVQLMFSPDGSGHLWTAPHTIYSGPRLGGFENSSCYTGLRETADGRLLLVYDTNTPGQAWNHTDSQINAVLIDVEA